MPMSIPFKPGQRFRSAVPGENTVVEVINLGGHHRPGQIFIGTVELGKPVRQRWANAQRFHDSKWTQNETVRRSGWVLERAL